VIQPLRLRTNASSWSKRARRYSDRDDINKAVIGLIACMQQVGPDQDRGRIDDARGRFSQTIIAIVPKFALRS